MADTCLEIVVKQFARISFSMRLGGWGGGGGEEGEEAMLRKHLKINHALRQPSFPIEASRRRSHNQECVCAWIAMKDRSSLSLVKT